MSQRNIVIVGLIFAFLVIALLAEYTGAKNAPVRRDTQVSVLP